MRPDSCDEDLRELSLLPSKVQIFGTVPGGKYLVNMGCLYSNASMLSCYEELINY